MKFDKTVHLFGFLTILVIWKLHQGCTQLMPVDTTTMSLCFGEAFDAMGEGKITEEEHLGFVLAHFRGSDTLKTAE